jgi:RimJ/RimL family protein N-acetyltransferase
MSGVLRRVVTKIMMNSPMRVFGRLETAPEVVFYTKDTPEERPAATVVELTRKNLELLRSDRSRPWATEIGDSSWFNSKGRLFAVKERGDMVSFGWARPSRSFHVGELGGVVELHAVALWIWACYTPPQYRGQGYYPALLGGIRRLTNEPQTVIYCLSSNLASRRGIEKAGFDESFSLLTRRLYVIPRLKSEILFSCFRAD